MTTPIINDNQSQLVQNALRNLQEITPNSQPAVNKALLELATLYRCGVLTSLVPVLPFLLELKGKPFTLDNHFVMEPLYKLKDVPIRQIMKCGRQVSKSTTLAAQGVLISAIVPYLNTINVAPLFEQIRRFSNNFVRPFIDQSPIKNVLIGEGLRQDQSVFQRTFANHSNMFFTFAFLDAERARGIAGDLLKLDEIQDIDLDHLPVLESCLDASDLGLVHMSGTPKTSDNTIDYFWGQSSQAHWVTKCDSCGHHNIAGLEFGLEDMIQPHGFCCQKCQALLNPKQGFFYHAYKDRAHLFAGYHIPQPVMPMHYGNERKWYSLYQKKLKWPRFRFLNEVLGESCDVGSRLVTLTQLRKRACLPWKLTVQNALEQVNQQYSFITMGVDWGGGGGGIVKKKRNLLTVEGGTTSFTVITTTGFKPHNMIHPEVIYSERLPIDMKPSDEVTRILQLYNMFNCKILAHDYGGAGSIRESTLIQAGFPQERLMPCVYTHSPNRPIIRGNEPTLGAHRWFYSIDKARSLALLCSAINADLVSFPQWPAASENEVCLYEDFLSLIESRVDTAKGSDTYLIIKNPKQPDDFCHSLNYACMAGWYANHIYPDLANRFGISMGTAADQPDEVSDW